MVTAGSRSSNKRASTVALGTRTPCEVDYKPIVSAVNRGATITG